MSVDPHHVTKNRYGLSEWAGAFGDLGTLIPFVAAYIAVLKMEASGVLVAFGIALIAVGSIYKTPFPVQPMKAIGAASVSQAALIAGLGSGAVIAASLATGFIWLLLALTGLARRISLWVPRPALLGVIMGLGYSFMLEGLQMMAPTPWIAATILALALLMSARPRVPAMLVLLAIGACLAWFENPSLLRDLAAMEPGFKMPALAWSGLSATDLWAGFFLLALPQLPLTFGNAYVAIVDENNRLFPDRPVTEKSVALSTGLMNIGSSFIGGIPMCHGAGGMAGHVSFGARTGGSSIILGVCLLGAGLFLSSSVQTIFQMFPNSVLGVILFMAGLQLSLGSRDSGGEKADRFVILATSAVAIVHVGAAVVFGLLAYHAARRGWLRV